MATYSKPVKRVIHRDNKPKPRNVKKGGRKR